MKPELGSLDDLVGRIDARMAASALSAVEIPAEEASLRSAPRQHVVITLAGLRCAVPIESVVETGYAPGAPGLTFVPRLPAWVAGVTNLRGDVLAVIDLALLLGFAPLERRAALRFLVAQSTTLDCRAGFLVEGLHGAFSVREESVLRTVPPLDARLAGVSRGTVEREGEKLALLDLEAVFQLPAVRRLRDA